MDTLSNARTIHNVYEFSPDPRGAPREKPRVRPPPDGNGAPLGKPTPEDLEELRQQQELDAEAERLEAEQRDRDEAERWERIAAEENAAQAGRVTEEEYEAHREQAQQEARAEEQEAAHPTALCLAALRALPTNPPIHALHAALEEFRREAVKLKPVERVLARGEAISILREKNRRDGARLVDAVLPREKKDEPAATLLYDPEAADHAVDGAALLEEMTRTLAKYLVLPPGAATAIALWTVAAHEIDHYASFPALLFTSPTMACGKTRAMEVVAHMTRKPLLAASLSPAVFFRVIEKYKPTVVLDEVDEILNDKKNELRALLNSRFTRSTARSVRCDGDDHEPKIFSTWSPFVMGMIGLPHGTLHSRCITVSMQRRAPGEKIARAEAGELEIELRAIASRIRRWSEDHATELGAARPDIPAQIDGDRPKDCWRPLLGVADVVGGVWSERARRAALELVGAEVEEQETAHLLLSDLRDLFTERGVEKLTTESILEHLNGLEERPWPGWARGSGFKARHLGAMLKRFKDARGGKVGSTTFKLAGVGHKGYELAAFADPFARYLSPLPPNGTFKRNCRNSADTTQENGENGTVTNSPGYGKENAETVNDNNAVTAVTAKSTESGPGAEKEAPKARRFGSKPVGGVQ